MFNIATLQANPHADMFTYVKQPEAAKAKLLGYQKLYSITTQQMKNHYEYLMNAMPDIIKKEIREWMYQYKLFLAASGDVNDLLETSNPAERGVLFFVH